MPTEVEKLIVSLEARQTAFERELNRANRTANSRARQIETRFQKMNRNITSSVSGIGVNAFKGLAIGATAALAPILSLGSALATAKAAVADFDKIAKSAKASGLDGEFFQILAHQADLGGVSMNELSSALQTFNKNSGLAVENKGKMVGALKALNPELLKSIQAAKSQEERVRLAADAIKNAKDASEAAAISTTLFGDAGNRLVEVFKGGAEAIERTAEEARRLGIVVDRELLSRAEELNDELGTATKIIDLQFKQALINLAPVLVWVAQKAAVLAGGIRNLVDAMSDVENKSSKSLTGTLHDLGAERLDLERRIGEERARQENASNRRVHTVIETIIDGHRQRLSAIAEEEQKILGILNERDNHIKVDSPPVSAEIPEIDRGGRTGRGGGSSRNAAVSGAIREAEAVLRVIDSLEQERAQIGMTDVERAKANALRLAGAAATEEQRAQIEQLVEAIHREKDAIDKAKQAAEFFHDTMSDSFMSLIPQIETGNQALDELLNTLIRVVAQAALLGQGPLAGMFGGRGLLSMFGFANGGIAAHGREAGPPLKRFARGGVSRSAAIFGEAGPEAAVPLPDGRRIPVDLRIPSGSSSGTVINMPVNISAPGADAAQLVRVQEEVRRLRDNVPKMVDRRVDTRNTRKTRA